MGFLDFLGDAGNMMTKGWNGPALLGLGLSGLGAVGSAFNRPRYERIGGQPTPTQAAGIGVLANPPQTPPVPQGQIDSLMEQAARLGALQGTGHAAARGFQVPGGGMIGMPQTIASEEAMRQALGLGTRFTELNQGTAQANTANRLNAASALAGGPGFTYRQRPSVFAGAMQAGQGFGRFIPQPYPMPQYPGGGGFMGAAGRRLPPNFEDAMNELRPYQDQNWPQ